MIKLSKRFICCLLAFILCCSFVAVNAENEDVITFSGAETTSEGVSISSEIKEMMSALKLFEIIPEYYDYNVPIASEVTRADFAAAVARLMDKKVYGGSNVYFYDVPKTHWAYNEISNLAELGVISGSGSKMFYPDTTITKNEAYKIILSAMGYDLYAEYSGGFPTGYIKVANKVDITKGLSNNEKLIMSDMFSLIYNAMKTNVMEPVIYNDGDIVYNEAEGVSILSLHRNVYYKKGVVKGANCITVDNGTLNKGEVLIGDVTYKSGDTNMFDYIGQSVEFFYHQGKADHDKTILWATRDNTDEVFTINVDYSASFDKKTFEYTYYDKNNRKKTINLDRGITLIYNGGVVESGYDEVFNKNKYELKLVKSKDKYTVAVVKEYENYVVGSINALDFKIYDKLVQKNIVLKEEMYDTFAIKMSGLTDMKFEDIKQDSVLSVYESKDKKHIEVIVTNNMIVGTVKQVKTDKNYYNISINDTTYRLDKSTENVSVSIGDDVNAYLDVRGEIAYIEVADRKFEGAFLIDVSIKEGLDNVLSIKYLAEDGKITVSEFAERVTIDGRKYKDAKAVKDALIAGEREFIPQFALIMKNSADEIREVDTIENPDKINNSLAVDVPFINEGETEMKQRQIRVGGATARIGEKIVFDVDTVVFSIPIADNYKTVNDEEFAVLPATGLINDSGIYAQSYKTSEEGGISKYILAKGYNSKSTTFEYPIIVEDIGMGIDEEGNSVEVLNGYQGNVFVSISASANNSDLFSKSGAKPGALVKLGKNNNGSLSECTVLYDYRKGDENVNSALNDVCGVFSGYVNNVVDDVLKIGYKSGNAFDYAIRVGATPVVIYDTKTTRTPVYAGTIGDAVTYKNDPDECSKIVIITSRMQAKMFLIYK